VAMAMTMAMAMCRRRMAGSQRIGGREVAAPGRWASGLCRRPVPGMMRHRPDAIAGCAPIGTVLVQSCNRRV
jgi:hypothetical protein